MQGAELMDLIIRTGSLSSELVAGNVEDLKALVMIIRDVLPPLALR